MVTVNKFNSEEKILRHLDKLDYFFNGHKTLVVTELDLTNKCNNNCPNCTGKKEGGAELSWDEIEKIISGLKEIGNQGIIISGGGEPLLNPHFCETLRLIRNHGMKVGLNSNGLALDREKAKAIAEHCVYFRFSLDAGTPEMYEKTHGMNEKAFDKVLDNIRLMMEVRNSSESSTSIGTGFLTGETTKDDMENFVKTSKDCEVDFAQFRPFTGDFTDIRDDYYGLKEKHETPNFKVACSTHKYEKLDDENKRPYDKCHGMFFSTVVTADAKMYACLHHRQNEKYLIGDIKKNTIPEIWRSARKWQVFENIDFADCPHFCRNDNFNRTLNLLDMDTVHKEFM